MEGKRMARKLRFFVPGLAAHVVARGNDRREVFYRDTDYRLYLELLKEGCAEFGCSLHAYVLMTNHVHLLLTPADCNGISLLMQQIGRLYVPYVNRHYGRSGALWKGRFHAGLVEDTRYLLACYRYIELNPVRAGLAQGPEDYAWSSYRANAEGEPDPLLTPHSVYLALGTNCFTREAAYRRLFLEDIPAHEWRDIRRATRANAALGDDALIERMEQLLPPQDRNNRHDGRGEGTGRG
jgi:putative transposase